MSRALSRPHFVEMIDGEFADLEPIQAPKPQVIDVKARDRTRWDGVKHDAALYGALLGALAFSILIMSALFITAQRFAPDLLWLAVLAMYPICGAIGWLISAKLGPIVNRRRARLVRPVSGPATAQ
jgi:hypothetical protein